MPRIVAIGGGKLEQLATLAIDREIVRLTGKDRPSVLFVPTASGDAPEYCQRFRAVYADKLGCNVDELLLLRDRPSAIRIKQLIASADAIYVGGGNTLRMMKLWRRLGVDALLERAWRSGSVLCGVSAGAVCWFESGCSDSMKFSRPENWKHIRVRGMNLVDAMLCPHYHSEQREQPFAQMVQQHRRLGIALDDHTAIEIVDDGYRIVVSKKDAKAHRLVPQNGSVASEAIPVKKSFSPLGELLRP